MISLGKGNDLHEARDVLESWKCLCVLPDTGAHRVSGVLSDLLSLNETKGIKIPLQEKFLPRFQPVSFPRVGISAGSKATRKYGCILKVKP